MIFETVAFFAMAFFLLVGAVFALVGAIGLLKFNDTMTRLHAPTKVGTMGIGSLLVASMINSFAFGNGSIHEILIMLFLFVTAPVSAHFMAKVNLHRNECEKPPAPGEDEEWATLNVPESDRNLSTRSGG
jgi:multicomponent K+:H+ antiporter subunit G